jgi:prophage antirepressor-like protein
MVPTTLPSPAGIFGTEARLSKQTLIELSYDGKPFHPRVIDGEAWFVGREVCDVLEIKNHRDALARLDDDEKGVGIADTLGGDQGVTIISLPGLYRLVFASRKAGAEKFKRWIAHEVLPAIHKTGRYEAPSAQLPPAPIDPRHVNRIRFAKLALVNVVQRLEDLGVDVAKIDMAAVVSFSRRLSAIGSR